MSYYKQALAIPVRRNALYSVGASSPLVSWPSTVTGEARSIKQDVDSLKLEVTNQLLTGPYGESKPSPSQMQWIASSLNPFLESWNKWYSEHGVSGARAWINNFNSGSLWEEAQVWRGKLVSLRNSAESVGLEFTGANPLGPREGGLISGFKDLLKTLLWFALAIAGIGAVYYYVVKR